MCAQSAQPCWWPGCSSAEKKGCVYAFPGGSVVKNAPANAGEVGLIPGLRRSPGARNGNPLLYTCLENSMDRGAWWTTVYGVAKSGM